MDHQHLQINGSSDWLALHPVHMPGFRDLYELSLPSAARQRLCNLGEHKGQSVAKYVLLCTEIIKCPGIVILKWFEINRRMD